MLMANAAALNKTLTTLDLERNGMDELDVTAVLTKMRRSRWAPLSPRIPEPEQEWMTPPASPNQMFSAPFKKILEPCPEFSPLARTVIPRI